MNNNVTYRRQKMIETASNRAFYADLELRRLDIQKEEIIGQIDVLENMKKYTNINVDKQMEIQFHKLHILIKYYKLLRIKLQSAKLIVRVAYMLEKRTRA